MGLPMPTPSSPRPSRTTPRLLRAALIIGSVNAVAALAHLALHPHTPHSGAAFWLLGTLTLITGLALFARALTQPPPTARELRPTAASSSSDLISNQLRLSTGLDSGKCACLTVGIDHFEDHAKTHGPNIAEAMLAAMTTVFQAKLRASDIVTRAHGDIFVVVMPNTDAPGTQMTADRIRDAISAAPAISLPNGQTLALTASVGFSLQAEADSIESLLDRSYQALQAARQQGGDSVVER